MSLAFDIAQIQKRSWWSDLTCASQNKSTRNSINAANRENVLNIIRKHGRCNYQTLMDETGLSRQSLSNLTRALVDNGQVFREYVGDLPYLEAVR